MKVRKAVIPAAGLGTRLLPITKAVPKELLLVMDKPAIQYVVEEAIAAGIEEVIFILSDNKEAISSYFTPAPQLEEWLAKQGKGELLDELTQITRHLRITTVYQDQPLGLGHAILCARETVGQEPFLVILPDDLGDGEIPLATQLLSVYEKYGSGVVALERIPWEETQRYGVIRGQEREERIYEIRDLVEKPAPDTAPSDLAIIGRYILPPEIFSLLSEVLPGAGGEIQLTDALRELRRRAKLFGYEFVGRRHDAGTMLGLLETSLRLAMKKPQWQPRLRSLLQELLSNED
jgi:UTP--glucose-1-phosphate uridylyltransferase